MVSLTSLRREALSLYREALRAAEQFRWPHPSGRLWSEVLRESVRSEMRAARDERDPQMIARLLLTGRAALEEAQRRLCEKRVQGAATDSPPVPRKS